jgi:hypothetical protein
LVTGCERYRAFLEAAIRRFTHPAVRVVGFLGDSTGVLEAPCFDSSRGVVTLPVSDSYESLPAKVHCALSWASEIFPQVPGIWKTDDDIVCANKEHLIAAILAYYREPYWGLFVGACDEAPVSETRIQMRFQDKTLQPRHQSAVYCFGHGYWLNREALSYVVASTECYKSSYLEDVCTGYVLNSNGIFPKRCELAYSEMQRGPELLRAGHYLIGRSGETLSLSASVGSVSGEEGVRPKVRSFDVFDTLITRRCVSPEIVFDLVEAKSGRVGFGQARRQAEVNVCHQPYDLDVIYLEVASLLGIDATERLRLKAIEIEVEREQVIPIRENMNLVRDGDMLVSDMYLKDVEIMDLLHLAGFKKHIGILVSNDGKRSGRIWPEVLKSFNIAEHLGDNPHSDVLTARVSGVQSRHSQVHQFSQIEGVFLDLNLRPLAELCRELRLRTSARSSSLRSVEVIQASLNVPILLLASVDLARRVNRLGRRKLLFSSRDCEMWISMFEAVASAMGVDCTSQYFYTSRLVKVNPSLSYLEYCRNLMDGALIVDLCGTGWSISHLAKQLGMNNLPVYLLHRLTASNTYESLSATPNCCQFHSLLGPECDGVANTLLEMCNYTDHPMVVNVRLVDGSFLPEFARDGRPGNVCEAIMTQKAVFQLAVDCLRNYDFTDVFRMEHDALSSIVGGLYRNLSCQKDLIKIYGKSHAEEERGISKSLGLSEGL